jgi:uncharacterized protein
MKTVHASEMTDSSTPHLCPARDKGADPLPIEYPMLCVRPTGTKGRGVVALRRFHKDETIERAGVLLIPDPQWEMLNQTTLQDYYYTWTEHSSVLVFGFGSFYNHSPHPNATVRRHVEELVMEYVALRDIEQGEEVCVDYDCPLWFEPQS